MLTGKIDISQIKFEVKKLPVDIGKAKTDALQEIGQILLQNIKSRAPKNTGKYANSWTLQSSTENNIKLTTPYGKLYVILEFKGRSPGIIKPRGNALVFEFGGQTIFTKIVNHPGFKPIPHTRPALKEVMQIAPKIIYKHFGKRVKILKKATKPYQHKKFHIRRTVIGKTGKKRLIRKRVQRIRIDR